MDQAGNSIICLLQGLVIRQKKLLLHTLRAYVCEM